MRVAVSGYRLSVWTYIVLFWMTMAPHALAQVNTLKPFSTDGCSMMLDGLPGDLPQWRHCCVAHDFDYWLGGTETEREASDRRLETCIGAAANPALAQFVFANVRWGGSPYWVTTYRWGYGWPYWDAVTHQLWGYKTLDQAEREQVDALLPAAKVLLEQEGVQ